MCIYCLMGHIETIQSLQWFLYKMKLLLRFMAGCVEIAGRHLSAHAEHYPSLIVFTAVIMSSGNGFSLLELEEKFNHSRVWREAFSEFALASHFKYDKNGAFFMAQQSCRWIKHPSRNVKNVNPPSAPKFKEFFFMPCTPIAFQVVWFHKQTNRLTA